MTGVEKVIAAIEARNPNHKVVQMSDLSGLSEAQADALMVCVVNAGPPMTHPDQLNTD